MIKRILPLLAAVAFALPAEAGSRTGCYVAASGGYAATNTDVSLTDGTDSIGINGLGADGGSLGLGVGCDYQMDKLVVGLFADHTWHNQTFSVTATGAPGDILNLSVDRQWTVGGRAGVVFGEALVYGLVGYTQVDTSDINSPAFAASLAIDGFKGWVLGGGAEVDIGGGAFLGAEGRVTLLDNQSLTVSGITVDLDPTIVEAKARIGWRFGMPDSVPVK